MLTLLFAMISVIAIAVLVILVYPKLIGRRWGVNICWDEVLVSLIFLGMGYVVGWIFYRDWQLSTVTGVMFILAIVYYRKWKAKRKYNQVIDEFIEVNRMLISELHAGKSIERAYLSIYRRLVDSGEHYHPHMQSILADWANQFELGKTMSDVLTAFAEAYPDECIVQFVNMFEVAMINGSSLLDVIELTDRMIRERRSIESEIAVLIAQKKLEQFVISLAPLLLLYLMQSTSYEFIAPLYESIVGRLLMTAAMLTFIGCFIWSKHMTEIEL